MEVQTAANPVSYLRLRIESNMGDYCWAWHPSRPYWHRHSPWLLSEPDD